MKPFLGRLCLAILICGFCASLFCAPLFAQTDQSNAQQLPPAAPSAAPQSTTGILLMAHGGKSDWNQTVLSVAAETDKTMPTEVAFGMADRATLQEAVDKLVARGVKQIVAVPLFVSSHSIVIESTKYLLGARPDAPKGFADLIDTMPDMKALPSSAQMSGRTDGHDDSAGATPQNGTPSQNSPSAPSPSSPNSQTSKGPFAMLPPNSGSTDPNNPPPDPPDPDATARAHKVMDYTTMTAATMPTAEASEDSTSDEITGSPEAKTAPKPSSDPHAHSHAPAPVPPPVQSSVPIRMTSALDHHAVVAEILADRAAAVAKDPSRDVLILVAHGPNEAAENAAWLADMRSLASQIAARHHYARIECATLRDDAEPKVRDAATAELRKKVQDANNEGYHAIVVPLLLSYGGVESGLRERLDGAEHTLSPTPLLPDPRIAKWVLASASALDAASAARN